MPLDHIALYVPAARLDEMVTWLTAAGEPLGFKEFVRPMPALVALGEEKPWFWVFGDEKLNDVENTWRHPHLGFVAKDAETVQKWYDAAIKAGGADNGKPGPRPQFGPTYYAAFVKDPVLNINFEAVCKTWTPPKAEKGEQKENGKAEDAPAEVETKAEKQNGTEEANGEAEKHKADAETEQPSKKRARRST